MTLRLGDYITLSIWLAGDETPEILDRFMGTDAQEALTAKADKEKVRIATPFFTVKMPGEDRVPAVPKWLEAKCVSNGRKRVVISLKSGDEPKSYVAPVLLVAEAMVLGPKNALKQKGFLADLSLSDLADLRRRTREVWDKSGVGYRTLTDQECDRLIDQHGPDAAYLAALGGSASSPARH